MIVGYQVVSRESGRGGYAREMKMFVSRMSFLVTHLGGFEDWVIRRLSRLGKKGKVGLCVFGEERVGGFRGKGSELNPFVYCCLLRDSDINVVNYEGLFGLGLIRLRVFGSGKEGEFMMFCLWAL